MPRIDPTFIETVLRDFAARPDRAEVSGLDADDAAAEAHAIADRITGLVAEDALDALSGGDPTPICQVDKDAMAAWVADLEEPALDVWGESYAEEASGRFWDAMEAKVLDIEAGFEIQLYGIGDDSVLVAVSRTSGWRQVTGYSHEVRKICTVNSPSASEELVEWVAYEANRLAGMARRLPESSSYFDPR